MAIVVEIQKERPIEEGEYYAVLRDVQEIQGKYGPVLKFWFDITEPGYETSVSGLCSKIARPRSKLFRWLMALGADLSQATTFDVTTLKGAPAIIVVSSVTSPSGEEYVNVIDVKPAKMRRAVVPPNFATTSISGNVSYETPVSTTTLQSSPIPTPMSSTPVPSTPAPSQTVPVQQQNVNPTPINITSKTKRNPFIEEIDNLNELEF